MYPASIKIGVTIIAIALAGGAVIVAESTGRHGASPSVTTSLQFPASQQTVHTADWYVAHPDILKTDEARCGGDAASISPAACQNAASADQQLLAAQLQQAAVANAAAAKTSLPKTP
jgi:hypothetical protein